MHNPDYEPIAVTGCRDGNCSTVWRHRTTGTIRVRGKDPQNPGRELDVDISAADFAVLAPQIAAALQG
jgi:hypothetical protein